MVGICSLPRSASLRFVGVRQCSFEFVGVRFASFSFAGVRFASSSFAVAPANCQILSGRPGADACESGLFESK